MINFEEMHQTAFDYESPIKVFESEMESYLEGEIWKAVQRVGVSVDREELLKALQYDREQYQKGYNDALRGLEEQGLLLRLPCKVGDTFWELNNSLLEPCVYPRVAHSLQHVVYCLERLGKTTFLTKEEAEAALEEMDGEEHETD